MSYHPLKTEESRLEGQSQHSSCCSFTAAHAAAGDDELQLRRCLRYVLANDTALRAKVLLSAAAYYGDIASDSLQLLVFWRNGHLTYLCLNAAAILAACLLDLAAAFRDTELHDAGGAGCGEAREAAAAAPPRGVDVGSLPLVGHVVTAIRALRLRAPLGREASLEELRSSAARLRRLHGMLRRLESTALLEAVVEGGASLLVQGFALAYEQYSRRERISLALSVLYSILGLAWALAGLDGKARVLESATVTVPGADGEPPARFEVPLVCGAGGLPQTLLLVPLRYVEVLGRVGPAIVAAVACTLALPDRARSRASVALAALLLAAADVLATQLAGPPRAWRRVPRHLLALSEPLGYPAGMAVTTVPKALFYVLRALQNVAVLAAALAAFGFSPSALLTALSSEGRPAAMMAVIAAAAAVLTGLAAPLVCVACPREVPEVTRRSFFALVGVRGQTFPVVEDWEHRSLCERLKLLPRQHMRKGGSGVTAEDALDVQCRGDFAKLHEAAVAHPATVRHVRLCYDHESMGFLLTAGPWPEIAEAMRTLEALSKLSHLRELTVVGIKFPAEWWRRLVGEVLPRLEHFEHLVAGDESGFNERWIVDDSLLLALGPALVEQSAAYAVTFESLGLGRGVGAGATGEAVPEVVGSEVLDLERVEDLPRLTGSTLHASLPGLRAMISLHQLEVEGMRPDAEPWAAFAGGVLPQYTRLRELSLQLCNLDVEGWSVLSSKAFAACARLERLVIARCGLDAARLRAVAPGLGQLAALRALCLEENPGVEAEGWRALAEEALPGLAHLELLDLSGCGLDAARLRAVAPALRQLPALRELRARFNAGVEAEGWGLLAGEVLPLLPRLEVLDLRGCGAAVAASRPSLEREGLSVRW